MANGSAPVRGPLKGINTVTRRRKDGSCVKYHYHRRTGRLLQGEPFSPEFIAAYAAAEQSAANHTAGTFAALIRTFEGSPEFAELRETTRREYRRKFKVIDREWGSCPIGGLADGDFRRDVLAWRDGIAKTTPREADNLVSAIARVMAFALDRREIASNVLEKVRRVYSVDRSEMIWLPAQIDSFVKASTPDLGMALLLALHTGQRQGDLLRLPWSAYDGRAIRLRQSKGNRLVTIPCTIALRRALDGRERRGPLILTTGTGRAWTTYYFRHQWTKAARKAGITELHFHDLRGTAVTMLAEAGCTAPEIASITGHSMDHVGRILDVYLARTAHLAEAAIFKLEQRLKKT